MTSAAREAIAQAAGNIPSPAPVEDAGAAIRAAQADLERAVAKASLQNDPMRHAFAGLSAALGAFAAGIEAVRRPLDPAAQAELVCKASAAAADGARREAGRLALGINRRFAFGAGLGEAGGIADGTTSIPGGQLGHGLHSQVAVGGDEHRVRSFR